MDIFIFSGLLVTPNCNPFFLNLSSVTVTLNKIKGQQSAPSLSRHTEQSEYSDIISLVSVDVRVITEHLAHLVWEHKMKEILRLQVVLSVTWS